MITTREEFFEAVFKNVGREDNGGNNSDYNIFLEAPNGRVFSYHVGIKDGRKFLFRGIIDGLDTLRAYFSLEDLANYFDRGDKNIFPIYLAGGKTINIIRNNGHYLVEEKIHLS